MPIDPQKALQHEFAPAKGSYDADKVIVCDVFGAGEPAIPGIDSAKLVQAIHEHGHKDVTYVPRREDVAKNLATVVEPGDIVITLGAGDVQLTCGELLALLGDREQNEARG